MMAQKMGLFITSPPQKGTYDDFSGVKKALRDETKQYRDLTKKEMNCITALM